ncbi:PITH domain-containing protein [Spathaspora sp. JA1]|nr:PITH domain-containing protein [Spathaspora sp. JA1]
MSCEDEHYHGNGHNHNHGHNHGHDHDDHIAPIPTSASQSLNSKVDTSKLTALNLANPSQDLGKLFKTSETKYQIKPIIRSDCDCQLIINVPFLNGNVKLYSIIFRTNGDKYCPKTIKLFKNDKTIDFDNVETKTPTQKVKHPQVGVLFEEDEDNIPEVLEEEGDFVEHYLSRSKFTGVHHLTIFIEDIHDDEDDEDECRLHSIELRGEFTELNKQPVITLYESAANPADHKNLAVSDYNGMSYGA